MLYNLFPTFKIVEINNVAALRMGHIIAQTPAYINATEAGVKGQTVKYAKHGDYKFVENGLIVGLGKDNKLSNFDVDSHYQPCLVYTEELITANMTNSLNQFANLVDYKDEEGGEYCYVRALPLNIGDTFTTNNYAGSGSAEATVVNGVLTLGDAATDYKGPLFAAKLTDLPAGESAVEFTYVGLVK
jgi:hypothetical protein